MIRDEVVLVNTHDEDLGVMEKMEVHQLGKLHRAFSIFIFNESGQLLLQQRADHKYHGAGLWTNTCCSHPQWKEEVKQGALERLQYEMGMTAELKFVYSFIYYSEVENGLIEHELDYVYIGYSKENPVPNPEEVKSFEWKEVQDIIQDIDKNPEKYTVWFKKALPELLTKMGLCNL